VNVSNRIKGTAPIGGPRNTKTKAFLNRSHFSGGLSVGVSKICRAVSTDNYGAYSSYHIFMVHAYAQKPQFSISTLSDSFALWAGSDSTSYQADHQALARIYRNDHEQAHR
jgi:hypothetical protein